MTQPKIEGVGHGVPRMAYGSDESDHYEIAVTSKGYQKVIRVEGGISIAYCTGTVQVKASAGKVWWAGFCDIGGAVADATLQDGTVAPVSVYRFRVAANGSIHCVFDPPIEFATSIQIVTVAGGWRLAVAYT